MTLEEKRKELKRLRQQNAQVGKDLYKPASNVKADIDPMYGVQDERTLPQKIRAGAGAVV